MKKLLISGIAVVGIAAVGLPFYTGQRAQTQLTELTKVLEELHPGISATVSDYQKGLMGATGTLTIKLDGDAIPPNDIIDMLGEAIWEMGDENNGLILNIKANHGWLSSQVDLTMADNNRIVKEFSENTDLKSPVTHTLQVGFSGNATLTVNLPKFKATREDVSFDGGQINLEVNRDRFISSGQIGAIKAEDEFNTKSNSFTADFKLVNNIPVGKVTFKGEEIKIENELTLKNLSVSASLNEKQGLLGGKFAVKMESLAAPQFAISNIDYDIAAENIDMASIIAMDTYRTSEKFKALMMALSKSPKLTVNKISGNMTAPAKANLNVSGHLGFDGSKLDPKAPQIKSMDEVINNLDMKLDGSFDLNMAPMISIDQSTIKFSLGNNKANTDIKIGAITSPFFTMSPLSIVDNTAWKKTIFVYTGDASWSLDSFDSKDFTLKGLSLQSKMTSENDLMKGNGQLSIASISSTIFNSDISDVRSVANSKNLSESALTELYQTAYNFEAIMMGMTSPDTFRPIITKLIQADPQLSIDELSFKLDDAQFKSNGSVRLDATKIANIDQVIDAPEMLIPAIIAKAEASFSKTLMGKAVNLYSDPSDEYYYTKEELAAEAEERTQFIASAQETLKEMGILKESGNDYATVLEFKDGAFYANEKAVDSIAIAEAFMPEVSTGTGSLSGDWSLDTQSMVDAMMAEIPEEQIEQYKAMLPMFLESITGDANFTDSTLTFTISVMGSSEQLKGEYTIVEETENTIVIDLKAEKEQDSGQYTITFVDENTIELLAEGEQQKLVFVRK